MEKLIVLTMTVSDFQNIIRQSVTEAMRAELSAIKGKISEQGIMLTKREAAKTLSCSPSTIDNFRRQGKLNGHYVTKKAIRFDRSEVLALAKKHKEL